VPWDVDAPKPSLQFAINESLDWEDIDRDSFLPGKIYRVPSAATFACAAVQIAFTLSGSFSPYFNIFE
jgi:hypothetical protein